MEAALLFKLVHVAGVVVWVGGMVFAHFFLRPAVQALDPPQRLALMRSTLERFFGVVTWVMPLVLLSGVMLMSPAARAGAVPKSWLLMGTLGLLMGVIYLYIRFVLFTRLAAAVDAGQWPAGGAAMLLIRRWVTINLGLGALTVLVAVLRWPG
jgi:uncharacterized membrane protein